MESLERDLTKEIKQAAVPGFSVGVVKENRTCWMKGVGLADIAAQSPATSETVYMWFSMTKIVTATAVMQLVDQHKLNLEDPVSEYIPNFPKATNSAPVTIRQLLNHSSGLSNPIPIGWVHPAAVAGPDPTEFLNQLLAKHGKLKSKLGEKASYSNIGYVALGTVIAVVSGKSYKDYVVERVLKPLGMRQTDFSYTSEMLRSAATGYQKRLSLMAVLLPFMGIPKGVLDGKVGDYIAFNRFYVDGSSYGGLIGSAKDAARFLRAHVNGGFVDGVQLLSQDSVSAMQQITSRGDKLDFGLGWFRRHGVNQTSTYLEHLGGGAGFFNDMRIYPEESLGIVVMGNSTKFDIERIIAIVKRVDWN